MSITRKEPGSCVEFGPFEEPDYFDIENSKMSGIPNDKVKTVEFLAIYHEKLLLVEAKKTAPKSVKAEDCKALLCAMLKSDQHDNFEDWQTHNVVKSAYIADICQKFEISLHLALCTAGGRVQSEDMPTAMVEALKEPDLKIVFVLVITWSKSDWVVHVQDALNIELRKYQKINNARVVVLTAEQAKERGLVVAFDQMQQGT